jgi:pilus assembly protein Flp/PilA
MLGSIAASVLLFVSDKKAVTAIEYTLIVALIAVVIVGAVSSIGTGVRNTFGSVASEL